MGAYEVGYGKPPKHSQFKKGICPNPKGRGKRQSPEFDRIMKQFLDTQLEVRDKGKIKRLTRRELSIRRLVTEAIKGDVGSAAILLTVRSRPEEIGDIGPLIIQITNDPDK